MLTFPPSVARYVLPVEVNCVVEALPLNCCSALHEFAVVVPKASEKTLLEYWRGYVAESEFGAR
jgi:hypothetical protein